MSQPAPANKGRTSEETPISEAEQKLIDECHELFGEKLKGISESTVLRFVRGYRHEEKAEEKTKEMLGKMLEWREQFQVDKIVQTVYPKEEEFKKVWTSGIHGQGKDGHLVYIDKVGAVDASALYKKFTIEEIMIFHVRLMEKITREKDQISLQTGKRRYKQLVILDLKGLGMSHMGSKFTSPMQKFIKIDQEMYPETLNLMFIVNAGIVVKTLWALVSPFLDPITKSNIKFGVEELKNYIDINNIPRYLGGKCKCETCLITPFVEGTEPVEKPAAAPAPAPAPASSSTATVAAEAPVAQEPSSDAAANAALEAASASAHAEDDKEVAAILDKSLNIHKSGEEAAPASSEAPSSSSSSSSAEASTDAAPSQ